MKKISLILLLSLFSVMASASTVALAPKDFFIRWKQNVSIQERADYYRANGLRVLWVSSLVPGLERVVPTRTTIAPNRQAVAQFSAFLSNQHPGILYTQPNHRIHRALPGYTPKNFAPRALTEGNPAAPNDPMFGDQCAHGSGAGIDILNAWKVARGSTNIRVAVIDTGVDPEHPEMRGKLAPGYDFIDKTPNVTDHHGHGTHCSGSIGAATNNGEGIAGINQDVTIIPIRAVPTDGDETDADLVESYEFAVKAGARVASCSFGKSEESTAVADVITEAGKHGMLVAVAAGNDGNDLNKKPTYPAAFNTFNMVVVAAISSSGRLAGFSNYGLGKVDLAAPGVNVLSSTRGGYDSWSGTSMATPHVAGVAALALSANPSLTVEQLKKVLLSSVVVDPALKSKVNTSGRLSAANAVHMALSMKPYGFNRYGF